MFNYYRFIAGLLCTFAATFCQAAPDSLFAYDDSNFEIKFLDDFQSNRNPETTKSAPERIETDRHDFTQSTMTVGQGTVQIESGYTYFYNDEDGNREDAHTGPETMLRVGLTEDIEFRARWNYAWRFSEDGEDKSGSEDARFSLKFRMTDQFCWIPESALELRVTAPTGGDDWSSNQFDYGFDYIYGWRLTERTELYGSTGFSTNGLGDFSMLPEHPSRDRFVVWSQSLALGYEVTDEVTVYTEFYGLFSRGLEDDKTSAFFNVGADYYVTDNFVLDIRVGAGLTHDAEDVFVGFGGGYRL